MIKLFLTSSCCEELNLARTEKVSEKGICLNLASEKTIGEERLLILYR
jgi:hypothetical protein